MYQVNIINNSDSGKTKATYTVNSRDNVILIDDHPFEWDLVEIKKNYFHIIKDNQSFDAEIIHINKEEKEVSLKINGRKFNLKLKDKFDLLLEKLGMGQNNTGQLLEIKAPMPGLILNIHIEEGQQVKRDEPIMILEAMKMENIIKSPGEGLVKKINVGVGDSVDKNAVLVQF